MIYMPEVYMLSPRTPSLATYLLEVSMLAFVGGHQVLELVDPLS
jgi:hypothetical protein